MTRFKEEDLQEFTEVTRDAGKLLAGRSPEVQGAVLADLLATWLKGHVSRVPTQAAAKLVRDNVLARHLRDVWELVGLYTTDEWPE